MTPTGTPERSRASSLVVAELGKPHGIRGEVTALLRGVSSEQLSTLPGLRARGTDGVEFAIRIERVRPKSGGWILSFAGVRDRDAAEELRGAVLLANREDLPAPEPGEWYVSDLEGLQVVTDDGRGLGVLAEVLQLPANDVFVVRDGAREVLLPAIDDVIVAVDLEAGRMVVHLLPGLVEETEGDPAPGIE